MWRNANEHSKEFLHKYGPWALVAGASEGLGAAFAEALAERGLNLVLVARRSELLEQVAGRLSGRYSIQARCLCLDLSQAEAASQIVRETQALEVGLLVYNAAFSAVGPFLDHSLDDHLKEVDTNVRAPLELVEAFGRRMLAGGHGGIILMSSLSAAQGSAYISNYSATKAYNMVLAEGLWEEWRRGGVDVLACMAGAIRTPNYLASSPRHTGTISDATLEPERVVAEALAGLGHRPTVIPGRLNRLSSFVMRHLIPRRASVQIMGSVLRGMYVHDNPDDTEAKK
ncbi:MAG: SDR family NAD(P)-dependent oxidoreductase [Anaerolineales bacterium]